MYGDLFPPQRPVQGSNKEIRPFRETSSFGCESASRTKGWAEDVSQSRSQVSKFPQILQAVPDNTGNLRYHVSPFGIVSELAVQCFARYQFGMLGCLLFTAMLTRLPMPMNKITAAIERRTTTAVCMVLVEWWDCRKMEEHRQSCGWRCQSLAQKELQAQDESNNNLNRAHVVSLYETYIPSAATSLSYPTRMLRWGFWKIGTGKNSIRALFLTSR